MSRFARQFLALFREAPRRLQVFVVGALVFQVLLIGGGIALFTSVLTANHLKFVPNALIVLVLASVLPVKWLMWILEGNQTVWRLTILGAIVALLRAGAGVSGLTTGPSPRIPTAIGLPIVVWCLFTFYVLLSPVAEKYRKSRA